MLCQATRLTTGEEDNTSTTHAAHLRHAKKHTCNAEARRNKDLIDKDRLTTPKTLQQHTHGCAVHAHIRTTPVRSGVDPGHLIVGNMESTH